MDRVRLRFWNALLHFCMFMFVLCSALTSLELTGESLYPLNRLPLFALSLDYLQVPPPIWVPLAFFGLFFAAVACAAFRRKELWHPSGFTTLPAPNGGYLRKAGLAHLTKELSRVPGRTKRAAKKHFRMAERYFVENQYMNAATEYRKSASIFATMSAHLNEGISHCYTHHFQKAADAFGEGLSMALKGGNRSLASALHCNMCIAHRELGNMQDAQESFKNAYRICMSSGDPLGRVCALGNSGTLLLAQGQPDEALESWQYALDGLAEIPCRAALAVALDGAGCTFAAKKEFQLALQHHRKAFKIFQKQRSLPGTTGALANIGQANASLGRRWRSRRANRKALKIAARYGCIFGSARSHASAGPTSSLH